MRPSWAELPQIYISLIPALKQGDGAFPLGTTRSERAGQKSGSICFKEQAHFLSGIPKLKSILFEVAFKLTQHHHHQVQTSPAGTACSFQFAGIISFELL